MSRSLRSHHSCNGRDGVGLPSVGLFVFGWLDFCLPAASPTGCLGAIAQGLKTKGTSLVTTAHPAVSVLAL